ncbi:MAG: amidohydrolase family protein, partial [Alphaproteobacteria bacterium]|nr:amidohydrolase family protein [Alphaproteobacteria bacterium]
AERIKGLGWHVEFLIHVDGHPGFDAMFADFPTDIVIGHMGYMRPGRDMNEAGFEAMVRLASAGRCWVKLTGPYRISAGDLPYGEVTPVARALLEAAPGRVIWGTDWPHVMVTKPMPNDGDLCDLLADWVPDADLRKRVLVDNPAELYGFGRP